MGCAWGWVGRGGGERKGEGRGKGRGKRGKREGWGGGREEKREGRKHCFLQVKDVLVRGLVVNEPELVVGHGGAVVFVAEDLEAQAQGEEVVFESEGGAVEGVECFGVGAVCSMGGGVRMYVDRRGGRAY